MADSNKDEGVEFYEVIPNVQCTNDVNPEFCEFPLSGAFKEGKTTGTLGIKHMKGFIDALEPRDVYALLHPESQIVSNLPHLIERFLS